MAQGSHFRKMRKKKKKLQAEEAVGVSSDTMTEFVIDILEAHKTEDWNLNHGMKESVNTTNEGYEFWAQTLCPDSDSIIQICRKDKAYIRLNVSVNERICMVVKKEDISKATEKELQRGQQNKIIEQTKEKKNIPGSPISDFRKFSCGFELKMVDDGVEWRFRSGTI
ncbi:uncharacterized protein HKW66_Vig0208920 [Vigna angularis]|uniref:Uncharacterized protein n=1 Tax=Phaseolus angularis TaxID=3914 RepID=A0A8T0JJ87_PHAAN|nr:uncharacterized protein HKW66_Vig0208920 [Vigna angularis]